MNLLDHIILYHNHVRLCAWMHQWHPLIVPEWHAEAEAASSDAPAGHR